MLQLEDYRDELLAFTELKRYILFGETYFRPGYERTRQKLNYLIFSECNKKSEKIKLKIMKAIQSDNELKEVYRKEYKNITDEQIEFLIKTLSLPTKK